MAEITGSGWQFSGVPAIGETTIRVLPFAETSRIVVSRENLPVGELAIDGQEDSEIVGPYLRISVFIPSDITGVFTFNQKVRILRKVGAFCRDAEETGTATLVYDETIGGDHGREEFVFDVIDQDVTPGELYYYTIFYGTGSHWAFSPSYGHARNYPYKNETLNGAPYSNRGAFLYKVFPSSIRYTDLKDGESSLEKLCNILGRMFDQLKEDLDFFDRHRFNIAKTDAARLPFIDYAMGWQTNLELNESLRRVETKNIPYVIKTRGTFGAIELVLQAITGWDIELIEGHKWALKTADFRNVTPTDEPDDWDEETDGVWAELNDIPTQTLFDKNNPGHVHAIRTYTGRSAFMLSNERVTEHGAGWHWQNENGVLIRLTSVDPSATLQSEVIRKVARIAAILLPRWVVYCTLVHMSNVEENLPALVDSRVDSIDALPVEETLPTMSDAAFDTGDGWTLLHTFSVPFTAESVLYGTAAPTSATLKTYSSWLLME